MLSFFIKRSVSSQPSRARRIVRSIGMHVVAWGGMLLLVLLMMGDSKSLLIPRFGRCPSVDDRLVSSEPEEPGWPHLRGPSHNGISNETDLADSWDEQGPPVVWIRELGQGYSGFTVMGQRIYTQTQTLYAQSVVCLDADSGETIWDYRYSWPYQPAGMYPGPRATPTWHAGRVYFAGPRGVVGCLTADSGRLLWSVNVHEKFHGRGTDFGYACSPLIQDGKLIVPVGGKGAAVVALDIRDGSTLWTSGDQPASYASPVPIVFRGRSLVVVLSRNALTGYDLSTGRLLFEHAFSHGYDEHAAAPLFEEPYLMIAGPFRIGADLFRLDSPDAHVGESSQVTSTRVWSSREMSNDVASCVLIDGTVYGFDLREFQCKARRPSRGQFKCMDLKTGDVLWSTDRTGHASLIAADGKLILLNDRGEIVLVRATRVGYEELGRTELFGDEICWTAPSLSRGRLYLRTPTRAACVYVGRPDAWTAEQALAAQSAATVEKKSRIDLAWLVGGERAFPADRPSAEELWCWFVHTLVGVLAVAIVLAGLVHTTLCRRRPEVARRAGRITFWVIALLGSVVATSLFNRFSDQFVFTWPLTLFLSHQLALGVVASNRPTGPDARKSWSPVAAGLVFFAVVVVYFDLCRRLDLAMLWVFLIGLCPSWPAAIPAVFQLRHKRAFWHDALWTVGAFTFYFAACAGYVWWLGWER